MIKQLKLKKFRCFKDYTIEFDKFNIIVGKNDTGKFTIIDALKLISNVRRYASYRDFYLEERDIPFSLINLKHNYTEEDVLIDSKFSDETRMLITFPNDDRPNVQFFKEDTPMAKRFRQSFKHSVGIIPPVGTFEESETLGDKKYLCSELISHLTPRHFRNIWYYFNEGFEEFQKIIEETWPRYSIKSPEFDLFHNT
jgi:predicted ATP-dependent endonuclease of OLD family